MLVLSRRAGESILIGGEIEIVILGTDGGQVRVGIRAPRDITVLRKELLQEEETEIPLAITPTISSGRDVLVEKSKTRAKSAVK
jgi:carbon storage regulator